MKYRKKHEEILIYRWYGCRWWKHLGRIKITFFISRICFIAFEIVFSKIHVQICNCWELALLTGNLCNTKHLMIPLHRRLQNGNVRQGLTLWVLLCDEHNTKMQKNFMEISLFVFQIPIKYTLLTRYDTKEGKGLEADNRDTHVG